MLNLLNNLRLDLIMPKCKQSTSDDKGLLHLIKCNGQGVSDDGLMSRISVWGPKKLPREFNESRFLCGYCAAQEVKDRKGKLNKVQNTDQSAQQYQGLGSLFSEDTIDKYGRRDIFRIFGADEIPGEDPYNTVIQVASDAGVAISRDLIGVCHPLPTRSGTKPIIAEFLGRESQSSILRGKAGLKEKK